MSEKGYRKVVCPNCQKEIDKQAEVEIPSSTTPVDVESIHPLMPVSPKDMSGVTHGNLVFRDGKYFLVFESVVIYPHCKELFCLDLWLPTLTLEEGVSHE